MTSIILDWSSKTWSKFFRHVQDLIMGKMDSHRPHWFTWTKYHEGFYWNMCHLRKFYVPLKLFVLPSSLRHFTHIDLDVNLSDQVSTYSTCLIPWWYIQTTSPLFKIRNTLMEFYLLRKLNLNLKMIDGFLHGKEQSHDILFSYKNLKGELWLSVKEIINTLNRNLFKERNTWIVIHITSIYNNQLLILKTFSTN